MTHDRPVLGIALMLGFCVLAPLGDSVAKLLGDSIPLTQVVLIRFGLQALILAPLVWATGRIWRTGGRIFWLTLIRTVLHILGIGAMFTALRYLPLADAIAIVFVMPFFMLILGKFILKEEVGPRRLIACLIGFIGTLLVIQPSFSTVGWPALLPVFVALNFSFFMLVTRQIAKSTDPIGLQAVSGVMAVVLIIPALLVGEMFDLPLVQAITPSAWQWQLLLAIGVIGTFAHLLMTWSLRFAPSATLAPMQYLEIPFATLLGYLIFKDLPNTLASVGIMITVCSGLYIILRERAMARAVVSKTPPPQPV